jgi:hypothetical protein
VLCQEYGLKNSFRREARLAVDLDLSFGAKRGWLGFETKKNQRF